MRARSSLLVLISILRRTLRILPKPSTLSSTTLYAAAISLALSQPQTASAAQNDSQVLQPEFHELVERYPVTVEVEFLQGAQPETFEAWLNSQDVTQRFEPSANGVRALLYPEDGLRIHDEGQGTHPPTPNILKTKIMGGSNKQDVDVVNFWLSMPPVENHTPVASAGVDQEVTAGDLVMLDGTNSYDPDGDMISYAWSLLELPEGSSAALDDASLAEPTFAPDLAGEYLLALVVDDGQLRSSSSFCTVLAVPPAAPVPDLTGLAQAEAELAIVSTGFVVGEVTFEHSFTVPQGFVVDQSPLAGTELLLGEAVHLVVSLGPEMVDVPDVVGIVQAAAEVALTNARLFVGTITQAFSQTIPAGSVISQDPAAGASVVVGSAVSLVVSLGPEMVEVPDVVGLPQGEAQTALTDARLSLGTVAEEYSLTLPAGSVISQAPEAGNSVIVGSAVSLVVSLGPEVVAVPDVLGLPLATAQTTLTDARLSLGTVTAAYSATGPTGSVIGQDPAAGSSVNVGFSVDLVISLGPEMVEVPDVVGFEQAAAEAAILLAGFTVGSISTQPSSTDPPGTVVAQIPLAGQSASPGSPVDLVIAEESALVAVPSVIFQSLGPAISLITSAGLVAGTITYEYSPGALPGLVIEQDPAGGMLAQTGSAVDLVISTWARVMPNLLGLTLDEAEAVVASIGRPIDFVQYEVSSEPINTVITQYPSAGSIVAGDEIIFVSVSLGSGQVTVPDLALLTQSQAETALTDAGLVLGAVSFAESSEVPADLVMGQSPTAGTIVEPFAVVDLIISFGAPDVAVPDLVGLGQAAAEAAITASGLVVGIVVQSYSSTVPNGLVMEQAPSPGVLVFSGSAVSITVSLGPESVHVPALIGLLEDDASRVLQAARLLLGNVTYEISSTVSAGRVISQNPSQGTTSSEGASVDILVSLGEEKATVPDVVGQTKAQAEATLLSAGFSSGFSMFFSETTTEDHVEVQSPTGGTEVLAGSNVHIFVSKGQPSSIPTPDLVGLSVSAAREVLRQHGLYLGDTSGDFHSSVAVDHVLSQQPTAGELVLEGQKVAVVASMGICDLLTPITHSVPRNHRRNRW